MSTTMMTIDGLLGISVDEPGRVFSGDMSKMKTEYHDLAKIFHPDSCRDVRAKDAFEHLKALYDSARTKIRAGTWEIPGRLELRSNGKLFRIKFLKKFKFELGVTYLGRTVITYVVEKQYRDLFDNAVKMIKSFKYSSTKMENEIARYLPQIEKSFETDTGLVLVVKKSPDAILLSDVVTYFDGKLDPKHVAWIMNCFYNIACYFEYAGITHNSISLDTTLIDPAQHCGYLLGGWWYAVMRDRKLVALPTRTIRVISPKVLAKKRADFTVDLELIRLLGRELLGDPIGFNLAREKLVPKGVVDWLRYSASDSAVADYRGWLDTLKDSFGARRFIKMSVNSSDIYKGD